MSTEQSRDLSCSRCGSRRGEHSLAEDMDFAETQLCMTVIEAGKWQIRKLNVALCVSCQTVVADSISNDRKVIVGGVL